MKIDLLNDQPNPLIGFESGWPIEAPPVLNLATEIYAKPISPVRWDFHTAFLSDLALLVKDSKNLGIPRSVQTNRVNFRLAMLAMLAIQWLLRNVALNDGRLLNLLRRFFDQSRRDLNPANRERVGRSCFAFSIVVGS